MQPLLPLLTCGIIMLACWLTSHSVDVSWLYHEVEAQSILKLYVIVNTLEIFDKLCAALSQVCVWMVNSQVYPTPADPCRTRPVTCRGRLEQRQACCSCCTSCGPASWRF